MSTGPTSALTHNAGMRAQASARVYVDEDAEQTLTAGYRHNFSYSMDPFVVVVVVVVVASLPPTIWHHFNHLALAKSSWNYFVLFNHISV